MKDNKKKTLLLLSDDIRTRSGVAVVSRKIIEKTVDKFNWVQIGARIKADDEGQIFDMSNYFSELTGVEGASVKLYPSSGYGTPDKLKGVMENERLTGNKIDAILHYTDPRYWEWLYNMEYEIRQQLPILYYHVWDNYPAPKYNLPFYKSCDLIMNISRQTHAIVRELTNAIDLDKEKTYKANKTHISYVPHGIDPNEFYPLSKENQGKPIGDGKSEVINGKMLMTEYESMLEFKKELFDNNDYKFVIFFNNRNILRKNPADLILAYNNFMESLTEELRKDVVLLMHTAPVDQYGTDLIKVIDDLCKHPVYFSTKNITASQMNMLYNIASVTCNISSAEGFGLSSAESLMAGTPVIVTVTGGLQDQCGFLDDDGNDIEDFTTNHDKKFGTNHGDWVIPIWPHSTLTGSIRTPYIFDDHVSINDLSKALKIAYGKRNKLEEMGKIGREFMLNGKLNVDYMVSSFNESVDFIIDNFKKKEKLKIIKK